MKTFKGNGKFYKLIDNTKGCSDCDIINCVEYDFECHTKPHESYAEITEDEYNELNPVNNTKPLGYFKDSIISKYPIVGIVIVIIFGITLIWSSKFGNKQSKVITPITDTLTYPQVKSINDSITILVTSFDKSCASLQKVLNLQYGDGLSFKELQPVDQSKYEEDNAKVENIRIKLNSLIHRYDIAMINTKFEYSYNYYLPLLYEFR